jgi:hypothetical protein
LLGSAWSVTRQSVQHLTTLLVAGLVLASCGGGATPRSDATAATASSDAPPGLIASATGAQTSSSTSAPAATKPATSAEIAAACTTTASVDEKKPGTVVFEVTNKATREVKMCWLNFYFYDDSGRQLARESLPYNYKIPPGETDGQPFEFGDLASLLKGAKKVSVETVISSARFTDGAEFEDKTLAPEQRPRGGAK